MTSSIAKTKSASNFLGSLFSLFYIIIINTTKLHLLFERSNRMINLNAPLYEFKVVIEENLIAQKPFRLIVNFTGSIHL